MVQTACCTWSAGGVSLGTPRELQQLLAAPRPQPGSPIPEWWCTPVTACYYDYIPQDELIANYTNVAGITTNPIGPKPVLPFNFDSSAWARRWRSRSSPRSPAALMTSSSPPRLHHALRAELDAESAGAMGKAASFELGYVGSKGTHLTRIYDANQREPRRPTNYNSVDTLATVSCSSYTPCRRR